MTVKKYTQLLEDCENNFLKTIEITRDEMYIALPHAFLFFEIFKNEQSTNQKHNQYLKECRKKVNFKEYKNLTKKGRLLSKVYLNFLKTTPSF